MLLNEKKLPGDQNHPTKPDDKPKHHISIIVNGVEKELPNHTHHLSYEDIVRLAYGAYNDSNNIVYTVVYSKGPHENHKGTLVKGDTVIIKKGMVFNVGCSNKS